MRRWIVLVGIGVGLISGCAEFRERQRLKTEMLREGLGIMKGMHGQFAQPSFGPGVSTPAPAPTSP